MLEIYNTGEAWEGFMDPVFNATLWKMLSQLYVPLLFVQTARLKVKTVKNGQPILC